MGSYLIALEIPCPNKQLLSMLCLGLPEVQWEEPGEFYVTIKELSDLNDQTLADLQESLQELNIIPFKIALHRPDIIRNKRGEGLIYAQLKPEDPLLNLKNKIEKTIRTIPQDSALIRLNKPHVKLGHFEKVSDHRLAEFLGSHVFFGSDLFEVNHFVLLHQKQTAKRTFYEVVDRFSMLTDFS